MQSEIDNIFELSLKEHPWGKADIGRNSISSLVNIKPLVGIDVGRVAIPQPNEDAIKTYLNDMKDILEAYGRHKALGKAAFEGFPQFEDEELTMDLDLPNVKTIKGMDKEERTRLIFSSPMKTIPTEIFGREDFNLNEPNIFSEVANYQDLIGLNNAKTEIIHHELNERLCLYRDTIQLKLLKEISNRTSLFLESLKSLQSLKRETQDALRTISSLDTKLAEIQDFNVMKGLKIIKLKQKLGIYSQMYAVVEKVANIKKSQPEIESLLQQKLYSQALERIQDCYEILSSLQTEQGKAPREVVPGVCILKNENMAAPGVEVVGVSSIAEQSSRIDDISKNAVMSMVTDFCETILRDYKSQIEQPTPLGSNPVGIGLVNTSIQKLEIGSLDFVPPTPIALSSAFPAVDEFALGPRELMLKASLKDVTMAILRTDALPMTIDFCKESYIKEIKRSSESFYPKEDAQDLTSGSQLEYLERIKSLSFEGFYSTLIKHYVFYLKVLRHFGAVINVICKNVEEAEAQGVVIGQYHTNLGAMPKLDMKFSMVQFPDEDINSQSMVNLLNSNEVADTKLDNPFKQIIKDAQSALQHIVEFTQKRCAKLILSRNEQHAKLSTIDFYRLYNSSMEFLNTGEQLCGKHCFELKKALTSQISAVVKTFHEEKTKCLIDTLQNEPWVSVEVPIEFHSLLDDIQRHNIRSLPQVTSKKQLELETGELTLGAAKKLTVSTDTINEGKNTLQYLEISDQKFYVVSSSLMVLQLLTDYLQFAARLPAVEVQVTAKILEFLQLFKSQTFGLIGCGGAVQSGAINRISAKHIALASQSLQMIITMIPYIKNALHHIKKDSDPFDRVIGDYNDSRQNLHAELLKIMSERISVHALEITQKINWDAPDSSMFSSNGTSLSMYSLMNETVTFHKIISKYLDKAAVSNIMDELFQIYLGKLKHEFLELEISTIDGRKRLLEDCKFLSENLEQLDNCDFPSSSLQVFVMENVRLKSKNSSRNGSLATISTFNSTASKATVTSPPKSNPFSFFRNNKSSGS